MVSTKLLKPARREYEPRFPNLSSSSEFRKQAVRECVILYFARSCQIPITDQYTLAKMKMRPENGPLERDSELGNHTKFIKSLFYVKLRL